MDSTEVQRLIRKFNVHDDEIQEHSPAIFSALRATCPVARSEAFGGFWMLSKYKDVYDAEHVPHLFSSFPVTVPPFGNPVPMIPLEMDPPDHAKYRKVVGKQFSPAVVNGLEGQVRGIVESLFENITGRREVDLVHALAEPLALQVLLDLFMDIPPEDRAYVAERAVRMLKPDPNLSEDEVLASRQQAGLESQVYLADLVAKRRANPSGTDLITYLSTADVDGKPLTDEEILGFLLLLIPAGFDTSASAMSRIFLMLAEQPELQKQLEADPALITTAVEEFLRVTTPVTGQARTVTQKCEFAGKDFEQGDRLVLLWAAANFDEDAFPQAEQVDLARKPNQHLAFGSGNHRCLGSHVARMELRLMISEFVRRMPSFRLDPDNPPRRHTGETWGLTSLPVIIEGSWS